MILTSSKSQLLAVFLVLLALLIPFLFLKSSYPFYRFGMFAETVRHSAQEESFAIFYETRSKDWKQLTPAEFDISQNAFQMQTRKHHYQNQHRFFIGIFDSLLEIKYDYRIDHWKWYHLTKTTHQKDSICVFALP